MKLWGIFASVVLLMSARTEAQPATPAIDACTDRTPIKTKVDNVIVNGEYNPKRAGLGDTISVELPEDGLEKLLARATCGRQELALFINGWRVKGLHRLPAANARRQVRFALDRNEDNKDLWSRVLTDQLFRGKH